MAEKEPVKSETVVKDLPMPVAEPAPLGLVGLGVAAIVLGLTDLGLFNGSKSLMVPWTVFLGATAQLIAGIMDFKRKNIFGATAFTAYALLWYTVSLTLIVVIWGGVGFDMAHYGYGLIGFLVFSIFMTFASLMTNKALVAIMLGIDVAIVTLVPNVLLGPAVFPAWPCGVALIYTSAASFYGAAGVLLNTMAGKTILPLGKAIWAPSKPRGK
ncbi:MAG: acetate uptake transporter [Candidatus Lokiarchaeota archaeon]|nr:acetate uptake transporter [Candidatus Lokiarchaeota archaeon]